MTELKEIVEKYQKKMEESYVRQKRFKRPTIGVSGIVNRKFLIVLFGNEKLGIEFLQEAGLLKKYMNCEKCQQKMLIDIDRGRFQCPKHKCKSTFSMRSNSFFKNSNLSYEDIMLLTYEILKNTSNDSIQEEYKFSNDTIFHWKALVREIQASYVEIISKQIGGIDKFVEIEESKFGERKFHKEHHVKDQLVLGGVQRDTGECFLVPVEDRTEKTLLELIKKWIKPGTTVISDSWKSYNIISRDSYNHLKVDDAIEFMKNETVPHINAIERTWQDVKASLPQYKREKFVGYFAAYIFRKQCRFENADCFNKFLEIINLLRWH